MSRNLTTIDRKFYDELGSELTRIRKSREMSLRDLSKLTGLSKMTLDNYELGVARMKPKVFDIICEALQVSPNTEIKVKIGF